MQARQKSEKAEIVFYEGRTLPWVYYSPSTISYSKGYKTQSEAVKAAFDNGFGRVILLNNVILSKEDVKEK